MSAIPLVLGGGLGLTLAATIAAIFIKFRTKRLKDARESAARESAARESWQSCEKKEEKANCIVSNNGRIYESLTELTAIDCEPIRSINKLWIKHAPLSRDCETLRLLFGASKPVLHIGMVFRYRACDRDALRRLVDDGFKLKPWENISQQVKPAKYRDCLQLYLQVLSQEEANSLYTEDEAAIVSCGEDGINHILTDQGKLHRSIFDNNTLKETSVVEALAEHAETMDEISTLWMKKAPTSIESQRLLELFDERNHSKPVLYIGHIHKYDADGRQGLKNLINAGFGLEVWEQASNYVKHQYNQCLIRYLEDLKREAQLHPNSEPSDYTESEVAVISCGEDRVTHLLTNQGIMYRNCYHPYSHAEKQFVRMSQSTGSVGITDIWIKNSPCSKCAQILRDHFKETQIKPIIHVGSIYKPDCPENREGLMNLIRDGFRIQVWDTINTYLFGRGDNTSEQYLKALEKKIKKTNCSP